MKTKIFITIIFSLFASVIVCANTDIRNSVCDSILTLPVSQQNIDRMLEQTIYKKELKHYVEKALKLSESIDYIEGIMYALDQLGVMERNNSRFAEALIYHNRCLALARLHNADYWILRSYINLGVVYRRIDEYETALQYFLNAFPLAEKLKNEKEIASCLGNIGTLYLSLNKLDDAMNYFRKSLEKAYEQNNYQGLAISYGSIGRVYENRNMLDSAQYCYERNLFFSKEWNDDNGIAISYKSMGNVAKKRGDLKKALEYYKKALNINLRIGDRNNIAPNYANLAEVYLLLGDMADAEKNYQRSLQIAQEAGMKKTMVEALGGLSKIYEKQNRNAEALQTLRRQIALKDSVLNEENLRRIEFMKISFDVQQKEQTITALEARHQVDKLKNRQKHIALLISIGLFLASLLFIIMYVRSSKQKRMIAEQRLQQLEQEKQLIATQAVLDGEARERTRIAQDLHDGLGSILTGVKLNLQEMKKGVVLEYADVERFDRALGLLDQSMQEMRRVAHHLMPDSLSRFGLKSAVNDFCCISENITFNYFGDETRLDPKLEVVIYHIIHELVNNALKYSDASQIMVQIMQEPDRIAFTIQDDGCGFDTSVATQGTGLKNICTRVDSFGGNIQIDSKIGESTEINVEFRIGLQSGTKN